MMLATNERLKGEQLTRLPNHPRNRVLPISALFGPNAAGKLRIPPLVAAHGWFQDQPTIIGVDSFYPFLAARVASDHVFESAMNKELSKIDTGIERVRLEGIPHERIGVPEEILKSLISNVTKDQALAFVDSEGVLYIAQLQGGAGKRRGLGDIAFSELQTIHLNDFGQEKYLRLSDESLGTRRFMTLLPMMADLEEDGSRKVYGVDELENSMHSLLTSRLLGGALASSTPASRWQLIFTTHDLTALEQDLLRRDEMWLAEKLNGMTELVRVTDFDTQRIRRGSDLLRAYMEGRLGAVPS